MSLCGLNDLEAARIRRLNWRNMIAKTYQLSGLVDGAEILQNVQQALDDNLNSPAAFAWIDQANNCNLEFWKKIDGLFGLNLVNDSPNIDNNCESILVQRAKARKEEDYAESDRYATSSKNTT